MIVDFQEVFTADCWKNIFIYEDINLFIFFLKQNFLSKQLTYFSHYA
jgi:hypothetical protein